MTIFGAIKKTFFGFWLQRIQLWTIIRQCPELSAVAAYDTTIQVVIWVSDQNYDKLTQECGHAHQTLCIANKDTNI